VKERLEQVLGRNVSRETLDRLDTFAALLASESERQNLVSRGTISALWERHLIDSAQLARFEPRPGASWVDIGSGAGLPGIVIACLAQGPVTLVEPRRLRADFLHRAAEVLDIRVEIVCGKAEQVRGTFDVITARAVADLPTLLKISAHLSTRKSLWVLPKGRNASEEVDAARLAWQGRFHVEPSLTDADSGIVVATEVKARGR
jgi:16S rRNA (guanine527-N7)-methyltransferase